MRTALVWPAASQQLNSTELLQEHFDGVDSHTPSSVLHGRGSTS